MRWIGYAFGGALLALGLSGLVLDGNLVGWAWWFGGVVVAHDAVLVPAVLLVGVAASRAGQWPKAALIVAALVTLATLPTVLALGRRADNPSILPLDYGRGLLLVLTAIGLVALVPKLKSRSVALGLSAGLAAGLLVAGLMAANDMIDPAQSALFLGHAALLGAVLGGVFGTRLYGLANAFACGLLAGLLAWVGWQLTLRPVLLGGHPQWSAALLAADSPALVGHLAFGAVLGVGYQRLEERIGPWWLTCGQAAAERAIAPREQTLGSAPAIWTLVLLLAAVISTLVVV